MRGISTIPALAICLAVAACAPSDPLERVVAGPTPARFAAWRSALPRNSSAETGRQFEAALQEIRLEVSGERERKRIRGEPLPAGGTDAIDEGVRERADQRTLREVVQLGCELRVRRLKAELGALEEAVAQNAQLITKPGDTASRRHLDELRDRQLGRVAKYRADIAATERELVPLLAKTGRSLIALPIDKVDQAPVKL